MVLPCDSAQKRYDVKISRNKCLRLSALTTALLACAGAWAQPVAPDAGQVLRDLQQTPALPTPQAPLLKRIDESVAPTDPNEARVMVRSLTISGNQEIATAELAPLVAGLIGSEQTLTQLNAAVSRITAHYRDSGFAVARAYLPAQDITDGTIAIAVIEGRIAGHKFDNRSLLSDARAAAYLGEVKDGDVIRSDQIDRGLLLLQDTPGVSTSRATLQPGASVGTSELLVEVTPSARWNANLVGDNYGSRYTGEYRLAGTYNLASPLQIGDQLTFGGLTSGSNLSFGRLAYQMPVGGDGWKVGAAYFDTHYKIGKEFEKIEARGSASSVSAFAAYPLLRSQLRNVNLTVSREEKTLKDYVDTTGTYTPKTVGVTSVALSGNTQDGLGGGGIGSYDVTVARGKLSIDSPSARLLDRNSARTAGYYTKVSYNLQRLQRIDDDDMLSVSFGGQLAGKNLDSSEKFSLGGVNGVRGYPQGEASGDEGYRGTLELRRTLSANLQGTLFYDWGWVRINRNRFGGTFNARGLSGAGFGLNASYAAIQFRGALAWRTGGGLPTSVPVSAATRPTLWLQASVSF
jgi:hemolysin activation/secretion protein